MSVEYGVSRGAGLYVGSGSEVHSLHTGRFWKNDGTRRGVVLANPHGRTSQTAEAWDVVQKLAEFSYPVISVDQGGTATFGNDTSQTRLGQARSYVQALGAKSGKVCLLCGSMGGLSGLNWARQNPTLVQAIAMVIPVVDLADAHDQNRGGYASEIETAYGGAGGYASALATHDPNTTANRATLTSAGIPIKLWYGGADTIANTPSILTAFAAAVGAEAVNMGAGVGHTITSVDWLDVLRFFDANGGRT